VNGEDEEVGGTAGGGCGGEREWKEAWRFNAFMPSASASPALDTSVSQLKLIKTL